MLKPIRPLRSVKIVPCRAGPLVKAAAVLAVVVSLAALLCLQGAIAESQARTEDLRLQARQLEQENENLAQYIAELGTEKSIIRIALEQLGLIDPDTVIITPAQ